MATVAIVVHPHPSMGGDGSHPLVVAIATALAATGVVVHTPTIQDPDVPLAAGEVALLADGLADEAGADRVVLVGYSWGSVVVSHALPDGLAARVLIAPPSSMPLGGDVLTPTLVLVPENDTFGGPDATRAALDGRPNVTLEVVAGEDHFLWNSIDAIAQRSVDFFVNLLPLDGNNSTKS